MNFLSSLLHLVDVLNLPEILRSSLRKQVWQRRKAKVSNVESRRISKRFVVFVAAKVGWRRRVRMADRKLAETGCRLRRNVRRVRHRIRSERKVRHAQRTGQNIRKTAFKNKIFFWFSLLRCLNYFFCKFQTSIRRQDLNP